MIHVMKIKPQYFNYIKYGTKEYELRLNDEKRENIKSGDFIELQKEPLLEEKIIVRVEDVIHYDNFNELLNDIDVKLLADFSVTKEELNIELEKFYSIEKQKRYGVVALKLRKNIVINKSCINDISFNDEIFSVLRNNYTEFDTWFNKMKANNTDVYYTMNGNQITSIMMLKVNETDSQQFFEKGNILKIRTFLVNDNKKGIGRMYLDIVDDVANENNIDYIYLTIKNNIVELINYMEKHDYKMYNQYSDEFVYYKELK